MSKMITEKEWDEASTQQRTEWLNAGVLVDYLLEHGFAVPESLRSPVQPIIIARLK